MFDPKKYIAFLIAASFWWDNTGRFLGFFQNPIFLGFFHPTKRAFDFYRVRISGAVDCSVGFAMGTACWVTLGGETLWGKTFPTWTLSLSFSIYVLISEILGNSWYFGWGLESDFLKSTSCVFFSRMNYISSFWDNLLLLRKSQFFLVEVLLLFLSLSCIPFPMWYFRRFS